VKSTLKRIAKTMLRPKSNLSLGVVGKWEVEGRVDSDTEATEGGEGGEVTEGFEDEEVVGLVAVEVGGVVVVEGEWGVESTFVIAPKSKKVIRA
jgi:hypothetical protein